MGSGESPHGAPFNGLGAALGTVVALTDDARRVRPKALPITSLAQLYQDFERIFLVGQKKKCRLISPDDHKIAVFDHNFFHLVKLQHASRGGRFRPWEERPLILGHVDGFGDYSVDESRARQLPAAHDTLLRPDAIIERNDLKSSTHVFYKHYGGAPVPYTITLAKLEKGWYVPVTSFVCNRHRARRWCDLKEGVAAVIWSKGT